ncbi:Quinone oxidoreductase 2 [Pseudocercospora fuligena]|uniref:Quinone oxidoreductase 2 n=1 Tax=Pseudocercospora fuligena TaxID=685502 RepID=A0A8H6VR38_9PEZI|nr:Quinone oxidoreductase 2 [Pseudocercospora fuligena]
MSSTSAPTHSPGHFLLTGVTGGLGAKILSDILHVHKVPPSAITATSRRNDPAVRQSYESQGLQFRIADYNTPSTLTSAFSGVHDLLFMSSSERDSSKRNIEHANVIEAAKATGVKKVWYVSLAFGGWGDESKIGFQQAHYETERLLKESGLDFVSLRAGVYADAFPLFLNWYPESKEVLMPKLKPPVSESKIAFTTRSELGEVIATILAKGLDAFGIEPKTEARIVLLTAMKTCSLVDLVGAINEARGTRMETRYLEPEEWVRESAKGDLGGKPEAWFQARLVFTQGVCDGDAEITDSAMTTLLGREPETGMQAVKRLLKEDPEFRWHQNHVGVSYEKYFGGK